MAVNADTYLGWVSWQIWEKCWGSIETQDLNNSGKCSFNFMFNTSHSKLWWTCTIGDFHYFLFSLQFQLDLILWTVQLSCQTAGYFLEISRPMFDASQKVREMMTQHEAPSFTGWQSRLQRPNDWWCWTSDFKVGLIQYLDRQNVCPVFLAN